MAKPLKNKNKNESPEAVEELIEGVDDSEDVEEVATEEVVKATEAEPVTEQVKEEVNEFIPDLPSKKDPHSTVEVRIIRDIGKMVRIGTWVWADRMPTHPMIDVVYAVPRFVAVHLAGIGAAVPLDSDIPVIRESRLNTLHVVPQFLR